MRRILVLSLLMAPIQAAGDPLPSDAHVYVEGSAEVRVEPDVFTIAASLEATNVDLAVAKNDVDTRSRELLSACRELGLKAEDISSSTLQIGPAYEYKGDHRQLVGTRVYREVEITLRNLALYPQLIRALVAARIAETLSTKLSSSKAAAAEDQALVAALADAKARAARLAEAAGASLGDVHSISEFSTRSDQWEIYSSRGTGGRTGRVSAMAAGQGAEEPFEPGLIRAHAAVFVVYLLDR